MSVIFVNSGSIIATAGGTSLIPVPGANIAVDFMVAMVAVKNNATISTPAGWAQLTQINAGASFRTGFFVAISAGSIASPTFSWTGSVAAAAVIYTYRGTNTNSTLGNNSPAAGASNPHATTGFTPAKPESFAIALDAQSSATAQATVPSGWNQDASAGNSTAAISFAAWSKQLVGFGASGAISVNEANVTWVQFQIEFCALHVPGAPKMRVYLRR